jgi:AbrB family looped-hinge helix DNA binding protein
MEISTTNQRPATPLRLPTIVTCKGQITIPAPIREALGLKEGDTVNVALEGDAVTLEPVSLSLAESFQSIPALSPSRDWKETLQIAHEDHAEEIIKKR